jgi:Glycosyl hydrolase family 20, domain 2
MVLWSRWNSALVSWVLSPCLTMGASPEIIPHPQYYQAGTESLDLSGAAIASGGSSKLLLAKKLLIEESRKLGASPLLAEAPRLRGETVVYLIDWSSPDVSKPLVSNLLDDDDRRVLSDLSSKEQCYILRIDPTGRRVALVGGSEQGVLYAATTLLQLWSVERGKLMASETHIRDYPDFRYRAAADWLLQAEVNRWAYDWGDGKTKYQQRIKRKLDFCLKYKINMVFVDGFGWTAEKTAGYAYMMRELNRYARDRGIKLIFGGYGAGNRPEIVESDHNIGKVYLNRYHYPHGTVYRCLAADTFNSSPEREVSLPTLGTCRANDELMGLKAKELEEFVRSVEPGALYIHHEDQGDFDPTQQAWFYRDPQCRRRWPNDDLKARDGGAGALAHGYTKLLEMVLRVKDPATGYDASKDCTVIMISPVYRLREESQQDWNNVLDLWENVISLMPQHENLQIGFREIFYQGDTGQRWVEGFRKRMQARGLVSNAFLFFLGGSQGYTNNYPFTATAVLNGHFKGAETIYNFSGGLHQEPLQILNGAFGWNASSPGSQHPQTYKETHHLWQKLNTNQETPREVFGEGGFLELACQKIYGPDAGQFMKKYFTHFEEHPRTARGLLAPHLSERIYSLVVLFDALEIDSKYWDLTAHPISIQLTHRDQEQVRRGLQSRSVESIPVKEWHARLVQIWELQSQVNQTAMGYVDSALKSARLAAEARADVEYLRNCLQVGQGFSQLLAAYHKIAVGREAERKDLIRHAERQLRDLEQSLHRNFQFDTVCPLGGDQASWLDAIRKLRNLLAQMS